MAKSKYRILIGINGKNTEFPVLPEKITVKRSADSKEVSVLELGNVNLLKGAKLKQISFSGFFPAGHIPAANVPENKLKKPMVYVNTILNAVKYGKKIVFMLIGGGIDINMQVTVDSFEFYESYGDVGSINYKITFKEYVDFSPKKVTIKGNKANSSKKTRSGSPEKSPESNGKAVKYTVKTGDCLWAICQANYGDGSLYDKLYKANKSVIDGKNKGTGNPSYTIYTGEVLTLPPKEEL